MGLPLEIRNPSHGGRALVDLHRSLTGKGGRVPLLRTGLILRGLHLALNIADVWHDSMDSAERR
jgi:hypothetical protein